MAKLYRKKVNLGTKYKPITQAKPDRKTTYPSFYISDKKLPITPKDVGKSFTCEIEAELTGIRESTGRDGNDYSYDFEMKSISFGSS